MSETIFSKIINKEIPSDVVYEDDLSFAFRDINPQAPVHILIIPKKPIPQLTDAAISDQELLGHLMLVANKVAEMDMRNGTAPMIARTQPAKHPLGRPRATSRPRLSPGGALVWIACS